MIETPRLSIIPLNQTQLLKYADCNESLEEELKLNKVTRTISPALREALNQTIIPNVSDQSRDYLFSTIWIAISKTDKVMVGEFCLMGEPNTAGEVEVGYGTNLFFQNKGYMTEIIEGLIKWSQKQQKIKSIKVSTEKNNSASIRVLEKNNFRKIDENEN